MGKKVAIIGGGLAGSESALQLAHFGFNVHLYEMRPLKQTEVHHSGNFAELVCSNSLKSTKPTSAAGMLKDELNRLGSFVYKVALENQVPAGGALAVNRDDFATSVSNLIKSCPNIEISREEVTDIAALTPKYDVIVLATGPLTTDKLANSLKQLTGKSELAFYDAAAPIVMADSLDMSKIFRQSRYEDSVENGGDYLNAPFSREEYEAFIEALLSASKVIKKDFETKDLFQACQPIEEIARKGKDAPRYGPLKPVGLRDPRTDRRPWAALQLRAEDTNGCSYNLVGFQTNLTFAEQKRVFRMIPGLEEAEFARFGVMHRNTYIDAPNVLNYTSQLITEPALELKAPIFIAGQLSGTEGYCEAIRSGLHAAISVAVLLREKVPPVLPEETAFGSLLAYSTSPETKNYQPMHVNFGIMPPIEPYIKNKQARYEAISTRGSEALGRYVDKLKAYNLLPRQA